MSQGSDAQMQPWLIGYLLFREDRLSSSKLYPQSVDIALSITGTFRQTFDTYDIEEFVRSTLSLTYLWRNHCQIPPLKQKI